jgi:alpha-L-fucosidase
MYDMTRLLIPEVHKLSIIDKINNYKLRIILLAVCLSIVNITSIFAQAPKILPTPKQVEWINKEIGVIIHLDINIYAPETFDYTKKETLPSLSVFNPSKLNTDQWIGSAKRAGAKYALLTVKHGTGFSLWRTKVNDYNVGNTPFRNGKADIVSDFIKSCKKYGLKPGFYYNTNMNTYYNAGYVTMSEHDRIKYNEIVCNQLEEIWSEYGVLFEIWFDGGLMIDCKIGIGDKVNELLKKYQPDACLFSGPIGAKNILRWVENEDGRTPYPFWSRIDPVITERGQLSIPNGNGNPDGKYWVSAEADFPNRKPNAWNGGWLWRAGEEHMVFSADDLLNRFYTSVGNNTNMLIGMAIDTSGLFPAYDARIFEEFGNKLKLRNKSIVGSTKGSGNTITIKFDLPTSVNQIEIREDISKGERIRAYKIEGFADGKWHIVCDGISIGHSRIQLFDKVKLSSIRLIITKSREIPIIKNFTAYMF